MDKMTYKGKNISKFEEKKRLEFRKKDYERNSKYPDRANI